MASSDSETTWRLVIHGAGTSITLANPVAQNDRSGELNPLSIDPGGGSPGSDSAVVVARSSADTSTAGGAEHLGDAYGQECPFNVAEPKGFQ